MARTAALVCAASVLLAAFAVASAQTQPPVVYTTDGPILGQYVNGTKQWLGIPFADPPVGTLRWAEPKPVTPWTAVRNATSFGHPCMQPPDAFTLLSVMSEDCLYLNVYAPSHNGTNLPVMIFFYGGSWEYGSSNFLIYDAVPDVDSLGDVIFVTANYRLGGFGWVADPTLASEDPNNSTGNYGLQDQRAVMTWVKNNAAKFQGDPNTVTIFGESAGAGSVSAHLVSKRSAGLFHRAGMESGPEAPWTAQPYSTSNAKFMAMAATLGCNVTDGAARVACMRKANQSQVLEAQKNVPEGFLTWSPVVDGSELDDYPENLAKKGQINKVPTWFGTNRDEGTLFSKVKIKDDQATAEAWLNKTFGTEIMEKAYQQYKWSDYPAPYWLVEHLIGDSFMTCPARRTARWFTAVDDAPPVYVYFYQHELEVIKLFKPDYGVFHASELAMVFDVQLMLWSDAEKQLARQFMFYWVRMGCNGDPNMPVPQSHAPNPPPMIHWPQYNSSDTIMILDTTLATQSGLKESLCDFWDTVPLPPEVVFGGGPMPTA